MDPKDLIFRGLIPGMDVVGEKFRRNEYYVPQVLLSARAMYAGLDLLKPLITAAAGADQNLGVDRDRHRPGRPARHRQEPGGDDARGRRLQGRQPRAATWRRRSSWPRCEEHSAHIVGISALMTTTMPAMKRTIDALDEGGPARAGEGHDRRGAGEPGVRRRDRRRRLRQGLDAGGGARPSSCSARCREWPRERARLGGRRASPRRRDAGVRRRLRHHALRRRSPQRRLPRAVERHARRGGGRDPPGLLRRRQRHRRDQYLRRHPAQAGRVRRSAIARAS